VPVLLICADGSGSEANASACRAALDALDADRLALRPELVDHKDGGLRTVGVAVSLPAPDQSSDEREVRRTVEALVAAMSNVADRTQSEFVIEYDGEEVGALDGGPADARFADQFFGTV
jgi:hypothetical protein